MLLLIFTFNLNFNFSYNNVSIIVNFHAIFMLTYNYNIFVIYCQKIIIFIIYIINN